MKKEEIIIEAYRLCEEIESIGFSPSLQLSGESMTIFIHDGKSQDIAKSIHSRFRETDHEFYQTVPASEVSTLLKEFINQQKQVA